jgi:hypothetical protein
MAIAMAPALVPTAPEATPAVPGRSVVTVQVPTLAPGAMGVAPLYGELRPNGGFLVHAAVSQTRTGNAMQDSLIRQFVPGTVSLSADLPRLVRELPNGKTMRMAGTVYVAGSSLQVPLFVRLTRVANGTSVRTFFKVPLSVYGVQRPGGGSAGDVRVGITAVFGK